MSKSCSFHVDPKPFHAYLKEVRSLLKGSRKLPPRLLDRIRHLFFDGAYKGFALECQPAGRALRVSLKPSKRALNLLAAIWDDQPTDQQCPLSLSATPPDGIRKHFAFAVSGPLTPEEHQKLLEAWREKGAELTPDEVAAVIGPGRTPGRESPLEP